MTKKSSKNTNPKFKIKNPSQSKYIDSKKGEKKYRGFFIITILIVAAVVFVLGYYLYSIKYGTSLSSSDDTVNKNRASDFTLVDLEGTSFSLSDYQGKVVIIDFMATWCGPCKTQVPHLGVIWEKYQDDIVIISIDIDPNETPETLQEFSYQFPYATWIWPTDIENLGYEYSIYTLPTIIIVDQEGYISFRRPGVTTSPILIEEIEQLLD